ncbi:hypothetical protein CYMTET_54860 [Cymbomonas tetramitiformis]|uniref:Uncharacterized protein n=1 Tax=Cymbomonas tetramitiformis TaxID=36881 RepID=A0AAE0EP57_9CHLO|nr:hypothetical protein CYMTET_54860 [Cymbomonas tetramitiformis]
MPAWALRHRLLFHRAGTAGTVLDRGFIMRALGLMSRYTRPPPPLIWDAPPSPDYSPGPTTDEEEGEGWDVSVEWRLVPAGVPGVQTGMTGDVCSKFGAWQYIMDEDGCDSDVSVVPYSPELGGQHAAEVEQSKGDRTAAVGGGGGGAQRYASSEEEAEALMMQKPLAHQEPRVARRWADRGTARAAYGPGGLWWTDADDIVDTQDAEAATPPAHRRAHERGPGGRTYYAFPTIMHAIMACRSGAVLLLHAAVGALRSGVGASAVMTEQDRLSALSPTAYAHIDETLDEMYARGGAASSVPTNAVEIDGARADPVPGPPVGHATVAGIDQYVDDSDINRIAGVDPDASDVAQLFNTDTDEYEDVGYEEIGI